MNQFVLNAISQFHFLRPWWLLAIVPAFAIAILLWQRRDSAANWRAAIAPDLIGHLLEDTQQSRPRWPWLLFAGWLLATFALAGPTWEKLPQPVMQKRDGLVIVLDLSLSMYAEDIKPSRLQRARFKVIDILQQRREGLTGLVVYSGDAHVVSPLTDDTATIENLVPALSPAIMPNFGSDAAAGIDSALQLLRNSGFERGRILLLSDEITDDDIDKIAAKIDGKKWQLSMIGIGTEQGAPIPLPRDESQADEIAQSGFIKKDDGTIAVAQLHRDRFTQLAAKISGRYDDIRVDDSDIANALSSITTSDDNVRTLEREFDQWRERGPQLVMLFLPLAALAFRRGWLLLIFILPFSMPSEAWEWRDLWQTPNQQAQHDFDAGNSKAAAEKFQDARWRAAAQYRSGDFAGASDSLQSFDDADAHYNRGNALAQEGKLAEAISAYDEALKKNPAMEDAKANRDLVEKLLKQQKHQQQKNEQPSDQTKNDNQKNSSQQNSQQNSAQPEQSGEQTEKQNTSSSSGKNSEQKSQKNSSDKQDAASERANQTANHADRQDDANTEKQNNADHAQQMQASSEQTANQEKTQQQSASDRVSPEKTAQQRATEQWLRQIPDDPSGLLRRKFLYESQQREREPQSDGKPLW